MEAACVSLSSGSEEMAEDEGPPTPDSRLEPIFFDVFRFEFFDVDVLI